MIDRHFEIIELNRMGNMEIGYLSFFEGVKDIPFEIKRVYFTYDVPENVKRGMHAHKELKQAMWCPFGTIDIILDDGTDERSIRLDSPNKVLVLKRGLWRNLYWRITGSILCVAASDYYNEEDYIRNYEEYIDLIKEGIWENED